MENACITQQFEVQQKKRSSLSDQYNLILAFLSLFFSMILLSLVNPLEQQEDSLIQKTPFTSEFLEANTLDLYEKNNVGIRGYLQNKHLYSNLRILTLTSKSLYQMFFLFYLAKCENIHSLIPFHIYTFSFEISPAVGKYKYQNIRT